MRTPRYWKYKNLVSFLLLPLGSIYAGLTALRIKFKKYASFNAYDTLKYAKKQKKKTVLSISQIKSSIAR